MTRVLKRRAASQPIPMNVDYQTIDPSVLATILGMQVTPVYVSDVSVGGLPAVGRGIDMIANAVATMLSSADLVTSSGELLPAPKIVTKPNLLFNAFEWWHQIVSSAMMRGNWVGVKADFGPDGYPRQIVPVSIDRVILDVSTGIPVYHIANMDFMWDEVVHIRANAPTGMLWGRGIIERYRSELTGMLHQQAYGSSSWSTGAVPSAVIQLDQVNVKKETAEDIQTQWIENHGQGQRKPAVIGKALSITPLSWSPEDAQYCESVKLGVAQAALICGLRPGDLDAAIGGSKVLSYGNREADALQRIQDSYSPWLSLIEQAWSQLIPGTNNVVRGNVEALLRTSTAERFAVYTAGAALGIYTEAELRELEHRPKLPTLPTPLAAVSNLPSNIPGESSQPAIGAAS